MHMSHEEEEEEAKGQEEGSTRAFSIEDSGAVYVWSFAPGLDQDHLKRSYGAKSHNSTLLVFN